jgi:hypothetical protein
MNNNNTDPTPCPSPTREGRTAEEAASLPSLVGEGQGVGSVTLVI